MKISYNWLKDYLECDLAPEAVAEALTSIGLEVDSLEQIEEIPGGLAGVIVAEVVECVEHPDSDHLHITKLNTGDPELLQVVCGAPNVAAGQKVLLATVGTVLGEDFKIKKSKIRGVESYGMICAEDELGIGESHDGIMVLEPEAVVGTPAKDYLGLAVDALIEIGLTANRVDAASHIGVARDLYAYLKHNGIPCKLNIPDAPDEVLLVLDGSTGQNAFQQAKEFARATDITALAITKLDGTAKGGVVVGIVDQFRVPIKFVGVGEGIDDLKVFNKREFVKSLFSKEDLEN